jgi:phage/plasmid-associated DNA primase
MHTFFGGFAASSTNFVCSGSFQKDRNAHDAGMEPFRTTRLLVAEELKHSMTLDVALLKQLSGGADVRVEGRRFGSGERFKFVWQANIVLVFNEGDCPQFDGDSALVQRLLVAPMRSKFVSEMPAEPEEHTYLMDKDITSKFPLWCSALLDLLLERFDPDALDKPPAGMLQWGQGVAVDANPLADWMSLLVTVTGKKEDYLLLGDLVERYNADEQLRRKMPAVEFKRYAKAYLTSVSLSFKSQPVSLKVDGVWEKKCNVARGIALVAK